MYHLQPQDENPQNTDNNIKTPVNNAPMQKRYGFFGIWGPVIIKMLISYGVILMAQFIAGYLYGLNHYDEALAATSGGDAFTNFSVSIAEYGSKFIIANAVAIEGISAVITIIVAGLWFLQDKKKAALYEQKSETIKEPLWKYMGIVILSIALCLGLNNIIILSGLDQASSTWQDVASAIYDSSFFLQIAVIAILAPLCEELVFRGLVFRRIKERSGYIYAALFSSAVFGITHLNWVQAVYGFIVGFVFTYLYEKFKSFAAPVIAHIAINLSALVMTKYEVITSLMENRTWFSIVTILCATIAATIFVWVRGFNMPENSQTNI
ncbi:MAG: CPBP family intramembrane metalloprotease [Lachnospiraceae bacterium]|jgi:membrane protease YdiL (CAAX protease family)|nr:CPBP family intramembrane metalloprotease [Lachnospiraceae bacterium]